MAKPVRYPRKLRQKLEKIASAREERETAVADPFSNSPFDTFYRSFLPTRSVHTMLARVDDVLKRIEVTCHMTPPVGAEWVGVPAPWNSETGTSD